MRLFDKAKAAAEQAAVKAKEGVEEVQAKRDLGSAYGELGTKTFELLEAGQLDHPELHALADRIRSAKARLAEDDPAPAAAEPAAAEPASDTPPPPPAMPS